jgi:cytoskeletal protein CcmA (bactofilin family)
VVNLRDLLDGKKDGSDRIETVGEAEAEAVYEPDPEPTVQEANPLGRPAYRPEGAGTAYEEEVPPPHPVGVSLISREATVLGDIITEGHIDIVGKVRGNVEAEGNIAVCGLVSGNLTGEKIGLYQCRVKGDLKAGTGVVIDSDSVIIGDVETDSLVLGGKLKGDIKAQKMAVLRSDAYFIGDVLTESLAVESGAVVNGNIKTIVQGDPEAPFND